jgi:Type II secretion system (T2SS), protein M subtype b
MHRDFTLQKRAILLVVGLLVAADLGMAIYSWQLASAPSTPQREFDNQNLKLMVLKGDIDSAKLIKDKMPATRKDCEKFEHSLPPAGIGTSSVMSELDDIAKKSGLQIVALTSNPKELPDRGVKEESIDATVNGDYGSVVRFLNGLQRSPSFYIVDGLALATDPQNQSGLGPIKVGIHLRTYFRATS